MIKLINNNKKIAVVGDCIIDEYHYVNAEKVSPEFPIPILQSEKDNPTHVRPGGSANVCYQFFHLNKNINYFSLIDQDAIDVINNYKFIDLSGCVLIKNKVPRKKRFYQDVFPLCRIDIEKTNLGYNDEELYDLHMALIKNLKKSNFDICVFSDYNKGLFPYRGIVERYFKAVGKNCIKIVDPKKNINKWIGCDIFKPNYKEAYEMTGCKDSESQSRMLQARTDAKAVVVTKGGEGIYGIIDNEYFEFRPQSKSIVNSVIGAGDCFVAYFAAAIAGDISIRNSVELAYKAASKYVGNVYNEPIHYLDVIPSKAIHPDLLINRNFKLSFTNGCFDILHQGHLHSLKFAKSKADKLVVALNSDESVQRLNKSHKLINNFESRSKMLESLECVDYIIKFDEDTPLDVIKKIKPDVLVKSEEYKEPVGADLVKEVYLCPVLDGFSTTKIIEKIKNHI
jgi:D-beta-D-heptose 7-phosphate kinase/D-beta-D-heptose 1-phosphate adenosyltransferase